MPDPVIQLTFHQHIHAKLFKKGSPLRTGQDHVAGSIDGKQDCLLPKCLSLLDLLYQLAVPAVDPVKFSHCYCTVGKFRKLTLYLQVFHISSCQNIFTG